MPDRPGETNVVSLHPPVHCPDCGSPWPGFHSWERCPGCLLSRDDIEAAAEVWQRLVGGAS